MQSLSIYFLLCFFSPNYNLSRQLQFLYRFLGKVVYNYFNFMSTLTRSNHRQSRGSNRAIKYSMPKSSIPSSITNKNESNYDYNTKMSHLQQPTSSNYSKHSIGRQPYYYESAIQRNNQIYEKEKQKLESQLDAKREKQKNKDFRIRSNIREMASSVKNNKEDEDSQRQMTSSLLRHNAQKLERQKRQKEQVHFMKKQQQYAKKIERGDNYPSTLTTNYSSNISRNPKTIGLVGLNNIGNTCFMNSILQCMFNLPGFNDYFLDSTHERQMKFNARVAEAYGDTIKRIRTSTSRSQTPSELKSAIGSKKSRFLGYSQQDAQEFLAALLELLSQDLNRSTKPKYKQLKADTSRYSLQQISEEWWKYNKQREDSIVCDYFTGQVLSRVVCSRCDEESIAFDNIWDMALNFTSGDDGQIKKMIKNFLKQQTISNDYYCGKCKNFRECKRKIDFYRLPKILVFQLKRFSYGRWRKVKLSNYVSVQETLDLSEFITQSTHASVKNVVYKLVGIVNHSGDIDFGHYTADCKNPLNKKWYNFNDSHVSETRVRESFDSSSPYLLFYAKKQL